MIMPAITWRPTNDTNWTVFGTIQKDKSGSSTAFLPHSGTLFPNPNGQIPINRFASEPSFEKYDTSTKSISSLFEHSFGDAFKIRSNTRYSKVDLQYHSMYPNSYGNLFGLPFFPYLDETQQTVHRYAYVQNMSRDIFTTDNHGELNFGTGFVKHKLLFGVDARQLKERSEQGFDIDLNPFNLYNPVYGNTPSFALSGGSTFPVERLPDARQSLQGVYVQDQLRAGPLIFTAGLRHDKVTNELEGSPDAKRHSDIEALRPRLRNALGDQSLRLLRRILQSGVRLQRLRRRRILQAGARRTARGRPQVSRSRRSRSSMLRSTRRRKRTV